jgi:hypothetical protein
MTIKKNGGIFGRNPTFNDVEVDGTLTVGGNAVPDASTLLVDGDIGSTVQAYDADTAKLDVAQTFTAIQTNTAHPAFRAQITSTVTDVTGDNTTYDTNAAIWTENYDQGGNFSDGTFTAPVTGKYHFDIALSLTGVSSADHLNGTISLTASNRSTTFYVSPGADYNNSLGGATYSLSIDVDMDAADTAYWRVNVAGGSKTIDIFSTTVTSGHLIC